MLILNIYTNMRAFKLHFYFNNIENHIKKYLNAFYSTFLKYFTFDCGLHEQKYNKMFYKKFFHGI